MTTLAARLSLDLAFGSYTLTVPRDERASLARAWLMLAVCSLAASGILAVLLVLSRTPGLARLIPAAGFFHAALVAHVDLSVLVWFVAFAGVMWTLNSTPSALRLGWWAFAFAATGSAVMAIAPFSGGEAVMANYVPIVRSPSFFAGLVTMAVGAILLVARGMLAAAPVGKRLDGAGALRLGLNGALVAAAMAVLALLWSYASVPRELAGKAYYELLFWGPGHVLQFAWTLLLLVAWLVLAHASGIRTPLSPRVVALLLAIGIAAVSITPLIYLAYPIATVEHHRLQTWLMRFGGGLAIVPIAAAVLLGGVRARGSCREPASPLREALFASIALFAYGGLIGYAIDGNNVRIPAHYHGCIVSVTIAFMGLTYWLLPRLGHAPPSVSLARWQCRLYATGQALHITGLVWSGGYGVQRKVADGAAVERSLAQVAGMGVMGLGGLIAIAGGLLFVVLAMRAMRSARTARA